MNPRTLLFVLIMAVTPFAFISDTDTQVSVLPDTSIRFEICVLVTPEDDTDLDERLEVFLRRELRALGDVDIVKRDSDWNFLFAYNLLEIELKDGTKTGQLSIASAFIGGHPKVDYKTFGLQGYGKPGMFLEVVSRLLGYR